MKILAVLGSCNSQGKTAQATNALLTAAAAEGVEVESIFLPQQKLEHCQQCNDDGWGICNKTGVCAIKDDIESVIARIKEADAVIFATPVYFGDMSESMRAFLDRFRRLSRAPGGNMAGKPAVGICVAGDAGAEAPICVVSLEKVLLKCGFNVADLIPVRWQNLELKLQVLRLTGAWLVGELRHSTLAS